MASFKRHNPFYQDKAILRSSALVQVDRSAQITTEMLSRNTDGEKVVLAGSFVASVGNDTFRILPRVKVVTPITTASALIEDTVYPEVFLPGDVLYIQGTYAVFDVSATTVGTLTYNGRTVSVTPTGAGTTAEATVLFASGFNDSYLNTFFYFVADDVNSQLYVFSNNGYSIDEVTGDGTVLEGTVGLATDPQTLGFNTTAIGTVISVSETNGDITLSAVAAIDVPAGVPVGVNVNNVYGLLTDSYALTKERPNYDVGLYTRAKVYLSGLPYYDKTIATYLPEIDPNNNP